MKLNGGTVALMRVREKNLKITTKGEKMEKVKNTGEGTLAFKDDDGKRHDVKAGESVECNYKISNDPRLIIEPKAKKKKVI